uniref:Putative methyltransferase n=1 Tax=viral metagenome TaxID=1070528 RepID=A0A6M3J2X3_9ZZZZ
MDKTELGGLFYPTKDQLGNDIPFDSLFIPYIYKEIYFEGVYIDILNQRKDMVIVDVGANIGITADHFRKVARVVYAIEPSPEHFAALKKNKEFNKWDNVEILNIALADKNGEMEFSQNDKNRTMNSLTVGENLGNDSWKIKTEKGLVGQINAKGYQDFIKVKTQSMDTFFEENKIDVCDFMKFDTEGAEDLILRSEGFKKVANRIKAIEVEFHFPNWRELVNYMIELGFTARQYESSAKIVLFVR